MGPPSLMQPHIFNYDDNFKIGRLVALGVGAPLHPYFKAILEWYDIALIQLSQNSYKLGIAMYILYHDERLTPPFMEEFSFFFSIIKSAKGYFFLVVQHKHNNLGFFE